MEHRYDTECAKLLWNQTLTLLLLFLKIITLMFRTITSDA